LGPPKDSEYDFERIGRELAKLDAYDAAWNTWFAEQDIVPLRIGYERLSSDPAAVLASICETLGVQPPDVRDVRPGVAKLADETSFEWMHRYSADAAT